MSTVDDDDVISMADFKSVQKCYQKIVDCKDAWEPLTSQELQELIFLLSDEYLPRETLWHCSSLAEIVLKLHLRGKLDPVTTLDVLRECFFHMRAFNVLRGLHSSQQEMRERLQSDKYKKRISSYKVFLYQVHMSMYEDQALSWEICLRQDLHEFYNKEPARRKHWPHNNLDSMKLFQLLLESVDVQLWSAEVEAVLDLVMVACFEANENKDPSAGFVRLIIHWTGRRLTPWTKLFSVAVEEEENSGPQSCLVVPGTGDENPLFMETQHGSTTPRLVSVAVTSSSPLYPSYRSNTYKRCVIINFREFRDSQHKIRIGSERDVQRIHRHFAEERGYETSIFEDCSKNLTLNEFCEFLKTICLPKRPPKVLVMFLMSHGEQDAIILPSGEKLKLYRLLRLLQSNPHLQGVPKIIFLQVCLGKTVTLNGVVSTKNYTHACNFFRKFPSRMNDMYILSSTLPGHASFRDVDHGAVFIQATLSILKQNLCVRDVGELKLRIQDRMNENHSIPHNQVSTEINCMRHRAEI